jgi:hypothetical protein
MIPAGLRGCAGGAWCGRPNVAVLIYCKLMPSGTNYDIKNIIVEIPLKMFFVQLLLRLNNQIFDSKRFLSISADIEPGTGNVMIGKKVIDVIN